VLGITACRFTLIAEFFIVPLRTANVARQRVTAVLTTLAELVGAENLGSWE
jgi:hypothetical protein